MNVKLALVLFISIATHATGLSALESNSTSNADYCKVAYIDSLSGKSGTYRGECSDNKPNGTGTVTYYNGDKLAGTFTNGTLKGKGLLTSNDGNTYKGGWENGKRHGRGTYKWAIGSSYVGEWIDDKRHGKGVFTWSNGNRFEGEFRDNKRYNGKYYTSSGRVYKCRLGQCR